MIQALQIAGLSQLAQKSSGDAPDGVSERPSGNRSTDAPKLMGLDR